MRAQRSVVVSPPKRSRTAPTASKASALVSAGPPATATKSEATLVTAPGACAKGQLPAARAAWRAAPGPAPTP